MTDTTHQEPSRPPSSSLPAEAQAIVDGTEAVLGAPLNEMPIELARERMAHLGTLAPPGPRMIATYDLTAPGPAGDVPVRIYVPREAPRLPVLLWLHGGAWAFGGLDMFDPTCSELAAAADAIVVSAEYRLAPEHRFPAGLEDCYAALAWVAETIGQYGGDPARIAVGGDSAGGNLAAALTLLARDRSGPAIAFQLLVYPSVMLRVSNDEFSDAQVTNRAMAEHFWDLYISSEHDREDPYCAPMCAEDLSGLPPAFVVVPEVDPTRDDQERYAERLAAAGVRARALRYPGTFHGFFAATAALESARQAMADATSELRDAFAI
jgi:acetyl esterase